MNICDESQFLSLNFDIRVDLNEFMEKSFQLTFYLRLIAGMITKKGTNLQNICLLSTKPSRDLSRNIILIISHYFRCVSVWNVGAEHSNYKL